MTYEWPFPLPNTVLTFSMGGLIDYEARMKMIAKSFKDQLLFLEKYQNA